MIAKPKYNLDCESWGKGVGITIMGWRCCNMCHNHSDKQGVDYPGHSTKAGKRDYRKMIYKHDTITMLVCCGLLNICLKHGKQEALDLAKVLEKKYFCPSCKQGTDGMTGPFTGDLMCSNCKWYLK